MAQDRTAVRAAAPDRRPLPATMPPRAVGPAPTAPQQLQRRLGNQGTQALLSRAGARAVPATGAGAAPPGAAAKAASPTDKQAGAAAQQAPASKHPPKPGAPAAAADRHKAVPASGAAQSHRPAAAAAPRPRNAIAPVAQAVHQRAAVARSHTPPHAAVGSAQAAAVNPVQEQRRDAATQTVANLDAAKAEAVKRDDFKSRLKQAIEAATPQPKSESEAENVVKTGATRASGALRGNLASERDAATGPLKSAAASEVAPASQPAPPKTELQTEPAGPPPAPVSAAPVVPAPLPPERLDYSADRAPADQLMAQNKVSKEQLEKGNEPAFGPALAARGNAEKHEAVAATRYRQSEGKLQAQTEGSAQQALAKDLGGMHGARALKLGKVGAQQMSTMQKNAAERQRITDTVNGIKDKTRTAVDTILNGMEDKAAKIFEDGLKHAEQAYEAAFSEAKGGVGTWLTTWGSDWDKHIEQSLATARAEYLKQVSVAIDQVADFVEATLKEAKQRVADGRKEVETFVKGLDDSVKRFGEEALQSVSADFDAMGSEIEQRRDGLIDKLVQQYKDSYERMSAAEEKLRDESKSLWQRAYDATVGLVKKIIEFKNMLLGVLARAAGVVEDIIADPIGFLGNLVSGVMLGLRNFMSKIGVHLQKGLMDWLFGALGGAGLQLPEKFDLQGIVSIILQVLGLTYANFRARAVAIVGEPVVAGLEKAAEVFKVIVTEGIPGLWRFIKEKLTDLKSMVLDAIWDFIKERVIIAGITWVIGLLNPASAFFKACKAIYDIVMFFINRGSQIMALVNAIIESMGAIAKGSIGVAATWIENALAKAIPVAIGFLAGLLGLGDISGTIKKTIDKAQAPVNKAIDWVIHQAVKVVKAAGKLIAGAFAKKNEKVVEENDPLKAAAVQAGLAAINIEEEKLQEHGEITKENAEIVAQNVKNKHKVFTSLTTVMRDGRWDFSYTASPPRIHIGLRRSKGGKWMSVETIWHETLRVSMAQKEAGHTRLDEVSVIHGKAQIVRIFSHNNVPADKADAALSIIDKLFNQSLRESTGDAISARMRSVSGVANKVLKESGSQTMVNAHHISRVSAHVGTYPKTKLERTYIPVKYENAIKKWITDNGHLKPEEQKKQVKELYAILRAQLMEDQHPDEEAPLAEVEMVVTTAKAHSEMHKKAASAGEDSP